MAKVFAVTAACLAVALPCLAQEPAAPPVRLPTGKLQLIGANASIAQFFVGDLPKKAGDVVEVSMFYVQDPGVPIDGKPVTQVLQLKRFDCVHDTVTDLSTAGWDGAGRRVTQIGATPTQPVPRGSALEAVGAIVCEVTKPPQMTRADGNREAFTLGLQAIRNARQKASK